jgi:RNA polymerase sigma-70 factor (ECF subfamily)
MNSTVTKREIDLDLLKQGDRGELAALVEQFSNPVYRIAMNILHSEQDAEDIIQETFIKVIHGIRNFEGRSSLATWIYRIAVNEALMATRRRKGNLVSIDAEIDTGEGETTPVEIEDWCCRPEVETMDAELRREMDKAVAGLPEKLRIVFQLRDMEDLSIRETAQVLGLTDSAVKTRLLRARLILREELTHYFQGTSQGQ